MASLNNATLKSVVGDLPRLCDSTKIDRALSLPCSPKPCDNDVKDVIQAVGDVIRGARG